MWAVYNMSTIFARLVVVTPLTEGAASTHAGMKVKKVGRVVTIALLKLI